MFLSENTQTHILTNTHLYTQRHRRVSVYWLISCRYEEEINKRTTAENEFVVLKKVSGMPGPWSPRFRSKGRLEACALHRSV